MAEKKALAVARVQRRLAEKEIAKISEKKWKAAKEGISELGLFMEEYPEGFRTLVQTSVQEIKDTIQNKAEDLLSPLTNEIDQAVANFLADTGLGGLIFKGVNEITNLIVNIPSNFELAIKQTNIKLRDIHRQTQINLWDAQRLAENLNIGVNNAQAGGVDFSDVDFSFLANPDINPQDFDLMSLSVRARPPPRLRGGSKLGAGFDFF